MIGKIKNFFEPSKAHKYGLDYTSKAEAMYRKVAADLELKIIKKPDDPVELSMLFPKQEKLRTDVWVCLQNLDELWFVIDGYTCSMFPFEEVKDEFEEYLRGVLKGEFRIRKYVRRRDGRVFKSLLQQNMGSDWRTVTHYGSMFSLIPTFFYDVKDEFLTTKEAAELDESQDRY